MHQSAGFCWWKKINLYLRLLLFSRQIKKTSVGRRSPWCRFGIGFHCSTLNVMIRIIRKLLNISERCSPPSPGMSRCICFALIFTPPPPFISHQGQILLPSWSFRGACVVGGVLRQLENVSFRQLIWPLECWGTEIAGSCCTYPTLSSICFLAKSRWCKLTEWPPLLGFSCAR